MRFLFGFALLFAGACGPDLDKLDECEEGAQSCDCDGACGFDNNIHECVDGEWEALIDCGQLLCQEGEPPDCGG